MRASDNPRVRSAAPSCQPEGVRRGSTAASTMRRLMARVERQVRSNTGLSATFRLDSRVLGLTEISQARWPALLWPSRGDARLYINRDGGFALQLDWLVKCEVIGEQRFTLAQAWHQQLIESYPETRDLPLLFGAAFAPSSVRSANENSPWSGFDDLGVGLPRVVIECELRPQASRTRPETECGCSAADSAPRTFTFHIFRQTSESWTQSLKLVQAVLFGLGRQLASEQGLDSMRRREPPSSAHADDETAALRNQVACPLRTLPANKHWRDAVEATLADMLASGLAKVVLAQQRTWSRSDRAAPRLNTPAEIEEPPDAGSSLSAVSLSERAETGSGLESSAGEQAYLVERLGAKDGTGRFAWRCGAKLFLAATPEFLVTADSEHVRSEAVAGTLRCDESADLSLLPDKLRREHGHVAEFIEQTLAAAGLKPQRGPLTLRHFGAMRHVLQLVEAKYPNAVSPWTLIGALHPTPAVCGVPRAAALKTLAEREGFDRGWYSGVVGWIDGHGRCEAAVALRGLLVTPEEVHAFAGAGIVRGSEAAAELNELEAKFSAILELFGLAASASTNARLLHAKPETAPVAETKRTSNPPPTGNPGSPGERPT